MHVADVKPLLFHLLVWQQAVPRQREPAPAFTAARHSPEARPLEQEDGVVGVGEVGGVDAAVRMVSALRGGENVPDVLGEAARQAVRFHVERVHLFERIFRSITSRRRVTGGRSADSRHSRCVQQPLRVKRHNEHKCCNLKCTF